MLFTTTLNQMLVLVTFIAIGFMFQKCKIVPDNASTVISKLENNLFIPALVLNALMYTKGIIDNFGIILFGAIVVGITIAIGFFIVIALTKDKYMQTIYGYGIYFSNFSFMGNAVVSALFPEYFANYMLFTIPAQILAFGWAIPFLLTPKKEVLDGEKQKESFFKKYVKPFINPSLICVVLGVVFALTGFGTTLENNLPFLTKVISGLSGCMSPLAMILTGMIIAKYQFKDTFKKPAVYILTAFRLVIFPLAFGLLVKFVIMPIITIDYNWLLCMTCYLAMPLGLSSVIIPTAYGKDTSVAAGLALFSHILSVITIPLIFSFLL